MLHTMLQHHKHFLHETRFSYANERRDQSICKWRYDVFDRNLSPCLRVHCFPFPWKESTDSSNPGLIGVDRNANVERSVSELLLGLPALAFFYRYNCNIFTFLPIQQNDDENATRVRNCILIIYLIIATWAC